MLSSVTRLKDEKKCYVHHVTPYQFQFMLINDNWGIIIKSCNVLIIKNSIVYKIRYSFSEIFLEQNSSKPVWEHQDEKSFPKSKTVILMLCASLDTTPHQRSEVWIFLVRAFQYLHLRALNNILSETTLLTSHKCNHSSCLGRVSWESADLPTRTRESDNGSFDQL